MEDIGLLSLLNDGGFVVALEFDWWTPAIPKTRVKATDYFAIGQTRTVNPGDFGAPDSCTVALYAAVALGEDNASADEYRYHNNLNVTAGYVISGTTLDNHLALLHVG